MVKRSSICRLEKPAKSLNFTVFTPFSGEPLNLVILSIISYLRDKINLFFYEIDRLRDQHFGV